MSKTNFPDHRRQRQWSLRLRSNISSQMGRKRGVFGRSFGLPLHGLEVWRGASGATAAAGRPPYVAEVSSRAEPPVVSRNCGQARPDTAGPLCLSSSRRAVGLNSELATRFNIQKVRALRFASRATRPLLPAKLPSLPADRRPGATRALRALSDLAYAPELVLEES
jgi:hypothetical protein